MEVLTAAIELLDIAREFRARPIRQHGAAPTRILSNLRARPIPVSAEMVFFETLTGGAAFSTGPIAWAGSLSHDGYQNNVAQISRNVLRRFLDPTPFVVKEHLHGCG